MEWNIFMFLLFTLYTPGSGAIPFMTASHFLLYIPGWMVHRWHRDLRAFSSQWQRFRRVCWHLASALEEENKSWRFIGSGRREWKRPASGKVGKKGKEILLFYFVFFGAASCHGEPHLKRRDLWGIILKLVSGNDNSYNFNYHPLNVA